VESLPLVLLPLLVVALNQGRVTGVGTLLVGFVLATLFMGRSWDLLGSSLVVGLAAIMLAPQTLRVRSAILPCLLIGMVHAVFLILLRLDWSAIARLPHPADGWNMAVLQTLAVHPWTTQSAWALLGGASSGALALLLLPLLKAGRTVGASITLRRYADLDQPLLKRLFSEAPGTYQHSMNVAYLAQAAGDAIGANPLLVRIGAYFHDIGKLQQPGGYIENQLNGVNLHDALDPYESVEVITGHVTQGLRIAREARLPKDVIDLIQQHHGTQAIDFFFHKALKLKPKGSVRETDFRYAGPKPQSVEAALLMIADAVEAASRSLKSPGRESFEKLVRFIVVKRIADSQFSECVLDTRDIDAILHALVDALEAAFHSRVRYPWQQTPPPPNRKPRAEMVVSGLPCMQGVCYLPKFRLIRIADQAGARRFPGGSVRMRCLRSVSGDHFQSAARFCHGIIFNGGQRGHRPGRSGGRVSFFCRLPHHPGDHHLEPHAGHAAAARRGLHPGRGRNRLDRVLPGRIHGGHEGHDGDLGPRHQSLQRTDFLRLGPSTGSATRGADGDIQFLQWGSSGGMPVIVLAPADVADCFSLTVQAFNLAEQYRCPVFIASNKEIAMTRASVDPDRLKAPAVLERAAPAPGREFQPFQTAAGERVPAFLPIGGGTLVRQTSSTHGPDGYITTDPAEIARQIARMQAKVNAAADQLAMVEHYPAAAADTLVIAYGVTSRAALAAVRTLASAGTPVSLLVLKTLWPVPEAAIRQAAASARRVVVVEMNRGQYVREVERILPGKAVHFCGQMDGRLIAPETIREAVLHG
jgi:2-oxoglutarate/2-oxoacid ferredoxin oxidoreductase subunit alpha